MKAVGYRQPGPLGASDSLSDIELPRPSVKGGNSRDLLVEVQAVSVNPVDTKLRAGAAPAEGDYKVLGYDAVGIVREVGANAKA